MPAPLRRWSSVAASPVQAAELVAGPLPPESLGTALGALCERDLRDATFLLIRLTSGDGKAMHDAIAAANAFPLTTRLCLAVDRVAIEEIRACDLDGNRVGLLLDEVDADTPLSDLIVDSIEAIRFRADFVAHARRNLRAGCALDALLGLAWNLGLPTFGPNAAANEASTTTAPMFDFVPSAHLSTPMLGSEIARPAKDGRAMKFNR